MTQNTSPMRLLILDTAENAAERVVNLLAKNRVLSTSERVEDKSRLFAALKTRQWDILLFNEDARDIDAAECVDFIRKHDIDTASVVLQRQEFDVRQLAEATRKGIAGLASLEQPEYSLSMLEKVMQNITERRNQQKFAHESHEAIAYIHDGMHVFANESYIKLFQYIDLEEVLATPFMDMVTEECRKELKLSLRNCQKSTNTPDEEQQIARMDVTALDANKGAFPANLSLKPTYYEGEHCLQVVVTGKQTQAPVLMTRMVVKNNRQEEVAGITTTDLLAPESLAAALQNDSLVLVYQPVMATSVMEPEFYDIYPQMRGPGRHSYSAEQIMRVAGNTALAQQLDRWVSASAIRMLGYLRNQGRLLQFQLTINAQTVRDASFSEWLASQLAECGVAADSLVLNTSEADVLAHTVEAITLINSLHHAGSRVCISGYTNCEAIVAVVTACKVGLVRFANDISDADSLNKLSLEDLKKLVESLHKNAVKVIVADVQDKETVDCLWLAEVDLVQGEWFQSEAQELRATSFRPEIPILRNVV